MAYISNTLQAGGDADSSMATTLWVDTYFLKLTGGSLGAGAQITIAQDPTADGHAARKKYVDDQDVNGRRFTFFHG